MQVVAQIKKELADTADECNALKAAKAHRVKQMEEWAEQLQSLERFKAVEHRKFRTLERNATGDKPQARQRVLTPVLRSSTCAFLREFGSRCVVVVVSDLTHSTPPTHEPMQTIEYLKLKQEVAELEKKVSDWERKARRTRLKLHHLIRTNGHAPVARFHSLSCMWPLRTL